MFGNQRRRRLVYAALAEALDDPATGGGWLIGLDIADRTGILPGSSWPTLVRAVACGDAETRRVPLPDGQGAFWNYRLTTAGIRCHQRDAAAQGRLARVRGRFSRAVTA